MRRKGASIKKPKAAVKKPKATVYYPEKNTRMHAVYYVHDSIHRLKLFTHNAAILTFIENFNKKYAKKRLEGYWIDLVIDDIRGGILMLP